MKLIVCNAQGDIGPIYLNTASKIGEGATANIYKVVYEDQHWAAKIFNKDRTTDTEKLKAMIKHPPQVKKYIKDVGEVYQLAWPRYILNNEKSECVGFLMPYIDSSDTYPFEAYFDPVLATKHKVTTEAALSLRLEIAVNICEVIANLHNVGHYFIDVKPQNIKVSRATSTVILMDCDGFSINNTDDPVHGRFPAELISTDYIAPEVTRNKLSPKDLAEGQDNYALAVLLFQLLNRGTHPFQGILNDQSLNANTNDEKASLGLYPYGIMVNPKISPRPQSLHNCFPISTRNLFDRAFTSSMSSLRPTAEEWKHHFKELIDNKNLVRCSTYPEKIEHIHFRDMPCLGCALDKINSEAKKITKANKPKINKQSSGSQSTKISPYPNSVSPHSKNTVTEIDKIIAWAVIFVVIVIILSYIFSSKTEVAPPPITVIPSSNTEYCTTSFKSITTENLCETLSKKYNQICELEIENELLSRGVASTPKSQCGKKLTSDINQLIESLKNSSSSTTITAQSLPTEKISVFNTVISYIATEFNNNNPKTTDGLDVYSGLRFKGLSGVMWNAYSESNCRGKNLGLLKACYSLEGDGNFACQWDSKKINTYSSYCLESIEK